MQAVVFGATSFHPNHASTFLADLAYRVFICRETFKTAFKECLVPRPHLGAHTSVYLIQDGLAARHSWAPKSSRPFGQQLNPQCIKCKTVLSARLKSYKDSEVKFKCQACSYQFTVARKSGVKDMEEIPQQPWVVENL
jgi:hypothetical protein